MSEQPEEEVTERPCIFCAGTGKVRDNPLSEIPMGINSPSAFGASSYFTIDPALIGKYDFTAIYGT